LVRNDGETLSVTGLGGGSQDMMSAAQKYVSADTASDTTPDTVLSRLLTRTGRSRRVEEGVGLKAYPVAAARVVASVSQVL
jgi:hypothetical protein